MDEVYLPPPEFAQLLVAQSAVQIHDEGGVHVLAPQLRSFREHARLLVGGVGASRRRRERELHRLLAAQVRADQISRVATEPPQQHVVVDGLRSRTSPIGGNLVVLYSMSASAALDGLLDPLGRCLDAESARRLVELSVSPPVQQRIDTLAERANEGLLTSDESVEYEALVNAADFISILKLKARQQLRPM